MKDIKNMKKIIFFCKVLIFFKIIISNHSVIREHHFQHFCLALVMCLCDTNRYSPFHVIRKGVSICTQLECPTFIQNAIAVLMH